MSSCGIGLRQSFVLIDEFVWNMARKHKSYWFLFLLQVAASSVLANFNFDVIQKVRIVVFE